MFPQPMAPNRALLKKSFLNDRQQTTVSQLSFADKIDLSRWKSVPVSKPSCPYGSIYYEETPAFGLRTILCHSISVWPILAVENMSGEKVYISGPHKYGALNLKSKVEFGHYNPKFVDWAIDNLIPDYQQNDTYYLWLGMYEGYLKPVLQASMKSYYDLEENEDYRRKEIEKYKSELFDQRGYYSSRWQQIKGDVYADGSQMYAFWIRRYIDGSATKIGSQLERFFKTFDIKFLNQARSEFGLDELKGLATAPALTDNDFAADLEKLELIGSLDAKISFLQSIRYNYSKPEQVSKILIKIGDLRPRSKGSSAFMSEDFYSPGSANGYIHHELSGDMIYTGAEYAEVIKLYPKTIFSEKASFKMLSIYQGGECEGEVGCEIDMRSRREIIFISEHPGSVHVIELLRQLEKLFDTYIKQIRITEKAEDYTQIDMQYTLKRALNSLKKATRNSSEDAKSFADYYNGLFYLKTNDLATAEIHFQDALDLENVVDMRYVKLAQEKLSSLQLNKTPTSE